MPQSSPMPEAYCLSCCYRLDTSADPPRCPECGRGFDPDDPVTVRIPSCEPVGHRYPWLPIVVIMLALLLVLFVLSGIPGFAMPRAY